MSPLANKPTRLVKVTAIATLFLFTPLCAGSVITYRAFNRLIANEFRLQRLSDRVKYLDEVLTMSALMNASTGDEQWERRYQSHVSLLDQTITESIEIVPESYDTSDAVETEAANIKLVVMEEESFRLVKLGRSEEALKLLLSPEYNRQKQLYSDGVKDRHKAVRKHFNVEIKNHQKQLILSGIMAGGTLIILIPAWFLVLQVLRRYLHALRVAQSELQKMSSLGSSVAGVAHEINNPVSCILGNVGIAQDYASDLLGLLDRYEKELPNPSDGLVEELETVDLQYIRKDFPQLIGAIRNSGDRITSISKSLRTFARSDVDSKQVFDLQKGLDGTLLILRHRLKANDLRPAIAVETHYDDIPEITCFPGQLSQVFMNILANAIDALDEASRGRSFEDIRIKPNRITIRTSLENNQVQVAIADNGPGMPKEVQNKIFSQSFTTKAVGKGTGLGLSIAKKIVVEVHQGTLDVSSEVGKGTEFLIALPVS
ncbi:MAG: sensor histidine kinase [Cyanophyceae cyanobacterium]